MFLLSHIGYVELDNIVIQIGAAPIHDDIVQHVIWRSRPIGIHATYLFVVVVVA